MNSITTGQAGQMYSAALKYASKGWEVFPAHTIANGLCTCHKKAACKENDRGKHPATKNGFLDATTSVQVIKKWPWERRNVAIRTGETSGLFVVDVDPRNGGTETFRQLLEALGPLPQTATVHSGGGGWHYYFEFPVEFSGATLRADWKGVDLQGNRCYVIGPPSRHALGRPYNWISEGPVQTLPRVWITAILETCNTGNTGNAGISGLSEVTESTGHLRTIHHHGDEFLCEEKLLHKVQKAIDDTLPSEKGKRHNSLFRLGRKCKAFLEASTAAETAWIADLFYTQLVTRIGSNNVNASQIENQVEWQDIWDDIRFPGDEAVSYLWQVAQTVPPPLCAGKLVPDYKPIVSLLKLLAQHGEGQFFLSSRTLAKTVGINNHIAAWRLLKQLEDKHKIIKTITLGDYVTKQASIFQYLGD